MTAPLWCQLINLFDNRNYGPAQSAFWIQVLTCCVKASTKKAIFIKSDLLSWDAFSIVTINVSAYLTILNVTKRIEQHCFFWLWSWGKEFLCETNEQSVMKPATHFSPVATKTRLKTHYEMFTQHRSCAERKRKSLRKIAFPRGYDRVNDGTIDWLRQRWIILCENE